MKHSYIPIADFDGMLEVDSCEKDKDYEYGRGDIGQEYYDFGTPGNRMVSKSSAKRIDASTILLGKRDDTYLRKGNKAAMAIIGDMKKANANKKPSSSEMFISISRLNTTRTDFDPGPGAEMAEVMKKSLYGTNSSDKIDMKNFDKIFRTKSKRPVSDKAVADFGHYRGRLDRAKVLILADPQGWDDIITARALTGKRGQYLQGLMNSFNGIDNAGYEHAVIKTVPFGMEGATDDQWEGVLANTADYRKAVLDEILLGTGMPDLLIADGQWAQQELKAYQDASSDSYIKGLKIVNIDRSSNYKKDMTDAAKAIRAAGFDFHSSYKGEPENIPSGHLSYYARVWEGTSGDRVITSKDDPGVAFAQVVPDWVVKQKFKMEKPTLAGIEKMVNTLYNECLPSPGEKPGDFLSRKSSGGMPRKCF